MKRKARIKQAVRGSRSGQWTFRLISDNGEPIAHSNQWYENKVDMVKVLDKYFPLFKIYDETWL